LPWLGTSIVNWLSHCPSGSCQDTVTAHQGPWPQRRCGNRAVCSASTEMRGAERRLQRRRTARGRDRDNSLFRRTPASFASEKATLESHAAPPPPPPPPLLSRPVPSSARNLTPYSRTVLAPDAVPMTIGTDPPVASRTMAVGSIPLLALPRFTPKAQASIARLDVLLSHFPLTLPPGWQGRGGARGARGPRGSAGRCRRRERIPAGHPRERKILAFFAANWRFGVFSPPSSERSTRCIPSRPPVCRGEKPASGNLPQPPEAHSFSAGRAHRRGECRGRTPP